MVMVSINSATDRVGTRNRASRRVERAVTILDLMAPV